MFGKFQRKKRAVKLSHESVYHIEMSDVHITLGGKPILRGMDVQIRHGETYVILGLSGAGKSVTIKNIIGLLKPDEGRILINGLDMTKLNKTHWYEAMKQFGYLFQSGALLNWITIAENVALPLNELTNYSDDEIEKRVYEKLEIVGLADHGDKYPSEVSGGMRKRAGLARAIVREPDILLYDEPTSGLDPIMSRQVDALINKLATELGITSIVVTHDMESAFACGDKIGFLYQGRMLEVGTPEQIRNSNNEIVKAFVQGGYTDSDVLQY